MYTNICSKIIFFCVMFIIYDFMFDSFSSGKGKTIEFNHRLRLVNDSKKLVENFGPKRVLTNTEADVSYEDYID